MSRWNRYATRAVHAAERGLDAVKHRLKEGRLRDPLMVSPYRTFGTAESVFVKGRVLEDKGVRPAREGDTILSNLRNAWKRFDSDEVPRAVVRATVGGAEAELVADDEGFFEAWVDLPGRLEPYAYRHETSFELVAPHARNQVRTRFRGDVIVPPQHAEFGVISDIDDTVLITEATSTLSMLRKILFGNARTRLPFAGVDAFYRALHHGRNPVFYVSSSPWNLYDLLEDFLDLNGIPAGPLMLRDWGVTRRELLPTAHGEHKLEAIEGIVDTYPELPFVLIGDSGQEDPEIYREVAAHHPGRVRAIYIRDVTGHDARRKAIEELADEVARQGIDLVLVPTTLEAAEHAAAAGWIDGADVARVAEAVRATTQPGR